MLWKDTWDKSVSTQRYSILCLYCKAMRTRFAIAFRCSLDASKQILVSDGCYGQNRLDTSANRIYVRNTHVAIWNPRIWFYMTFSGLLYTCMGLNTHYWPEYLIQWAVSLRITCAVQNEVVISQTEILLKIRVRHFQFQSMIVVHKVFFYYLQMEITEGGPNYHPEQTKWDRLNVVQWSN